MAEGTRAGTSRRRRSNGRARPQATALKADSLILCLARREGHGHDHFTSGLVIAHFRLELAEIPFWEFEVWNSFSFLIMTLRIKEKKHKVL